MRNGFESLRLRAVLIKEIDLAVNISILMLWLQHLRERGHHIVIMYSLY